VRQSRRFIIISAAALAAVGGGAAIAATQQDEAKEREDAVLSDAAEQLDVETDELRSALLDARKAQVDQAVEDGKLTQEQADQIKEHMDESGLVLGGPGGHRGGPGGPGGHHGPPPFFDAVAEELGISTEELHEQLHSGKSLRQIARAHDKTMADLRAVAKTAIEKQIADDLEAGRITEEQADAMRDRIPEILRNLGKRPRFRAGGPPPMGGPGGPVGPPPGFRQ
jgi:hypothetical protein